MSKLTNNTNHIYYAIIVATTNELNSLDTVALDLEGIYCTQSLNEMMKHITFGIAKAIISEDFAIMTSSSKILDIIHTLNKFYQVTFYYMSNLEDEITLSLSKDNDNVVIRDTISFKDVKFFKAMLADKEDVYTLSSQIKQHEDYKANMASNKEYYELLEKYINARTELQNIVNLNFDRTIKLIKSYGKLIYNNSYLEQHNTIQSQYIDSLSTALDECKNKCLRLQNDIEYIKHEHYSLINSYEILRNKYNNISDIIDLLNTHGIYDIDTRLVTSVNTDEYITTANVAPVFLYVKEYSEVMYLTTLLTTLTYNLYKNYRIDNKLVILENNNSQYRRNLYKPEYIQCHLIETDSDLSILAQDDCLPIVKFGNPQFILNYLAQNNLSYSVYIIYDKTRNDDIYCYGSKVSLFYACNNVEMFLKLGLKAINTITNSPNCDLTIEHIQDFDKIKRKELVYEVYSINKVSIEMVKVIQKLLND